MNEATASIPANIKEKTDLKIRKPENVIEREEEITFLEEIEGGSSKNFADLFLENTTKTTVFSIENNSCAKSPVIIEAIYEKEDSAKKIVIDAKENSAITVLMKFASDKKDTSNAFIKTVINAEKNAKVNIIQLDLLGEEANLFNDLAIRAKEDSHIVIHHLFLGAKNIYQGCNVDLIGEGAKVDKEIGYFLDNDQMLDTNYVALHKGRNTESDIKVSGVLAGKSYKMFRGTIDFINGCAGSKGNELEEVIILDDEVINKTIPIILCREEDVSGNHGASIGRLSEDLIFYLSSRGLTEEEIYELIINSRLTSFCKTIPDDEIRKETFAYISKEETNE